MTLSAITFELFSDDEKSKEISLLSHPAVSAFDGLIFEIRFHCVHGDTARYYFDQVNKLPDCDGLLTGELVVPLYTRECKPELVKALFEDFLEGLTEE